MPSTRRKRRRSPRGNCRITPSMRPAPCSRAICPPMSPASPRSAHPTAASPRSSAPSAIRPAGPRLPGGVVASVLAWEFFAPDPDDPDISEEKLLRIWPSSSPGTPISGMRRAAFNDWQQGFVRKGESGEEPVTDLESVRRAVQRMSDLLADARQAAERLTVRKATRHAFRLAPPALTLIGLALRWPPVAAAGGGAFLAVAGVTVDEKLFKGAEATQPAPTAFVQDAQRHFGWR